MAQRLRLLPLLIVSGSWSTRSAFLPSCGLDRNVATVCHECRLQDPIKRRRAPVCRQQATRLPALLSTTFSRRVHRICAKETKETMKSARAFAWTFGPAIAFFLVVRAYIVEPFFIPSMSMYPTLRVNDQIAVEKFSRLLAPPRRGDLVVFKPPEAYITARKAASIHQKDYPANPLVKRVVAVENDQVEVRNGKLLLNGVQMYEPYVRELARYSLPPLTVPRGNLFVLGDNRNDSSDSHVWGFLPVENVVGKGFYILWPINRQGWVDSFMQVLFGTCHAVEPARCNVI